MDEMSQELKNQFMEGKIILSSLNQYKFSPVSPEAMIKKFSNFINFDNNNTSSQSKTLSNDSAGISQVVPVPTVDSSTYVAAPVETVPTVDPSTYVAAPVETVPTVDSSTYVAAPVETVPTVDSSTYVVAPEGSNADVPVIESSSIVEVPVAQIVSSEDVPTLLDDSVEILTTDDSSINS